MGEGELEEEGKEEAEEEGRDMEDGKEETVRRHSCARGCISVHLRTRPCMHCAGQCRGTQ